MTEWQPMETAPTNGDFCLYGLTINNNKYGIHWFEYYPLRLDDSGDLRTLSDDHFCDWSYSDFTHWMPAPPPPPEIK